MHRKKSNASGGLNPIPELLGVFFLISQKLFLDDGNLYNNESKIEQKKIAISIEGDDDDLINGRGGMDITNSR